jgi:hypothetical protein
MEDNGRVKLLIPNEGFKDVLSANEVVRGRPLIFKIVMII